MLQYLFDIIDFVYLIFNFYLMIILIYSVIILFFFNNLLLNLLIHYLFYFLFGLLLIVFIGFVHCRLRMWTVFILLLRSL